MIDMRSLLVVIFLAGLAACSKKTKFELLDSSHTGVDFSNTIIETDTLHVMNFEYIYNGGGVGIADLNNDDLADIIFTGN